MGFFGSYLYRAKYASACLTHVRFSKIPRRVLHTAQSSPRRHLSQAKHDFLQQEWSWSTWKVLPLLLASVEPQIAHFPPCAARVDSYQSRVMPYWRNLLI